MPFSKFNLSKQIEKSLIKYLYTTPTSIQEKTIPIILNGDDVMVKSQTGSGKTAAYVLPLLSLTAIDKLPSKKNKPKIKILVLVPTRELAIQVLDTFKSFSNNLEFKPRVVSIIGGVDISKQLLLVQKGCDIVVATSGRLLDIISKKQIDLSNIKYFVLDEADKMLNIGFEEEIDDILNSIPDHRQNILLSATYPPKVVDIVSKITTDAIKVEIEDEEEVVTLINQRAIYVDVDKRSALLKALLKKHKWNKVLVFMSSKRATDNISNKFRKNGYLSQSFHGDLEQEERTLTLNEFKSQKVKILFSTDIASRGLHIDDIDCVVNYDLPRGVDDYVHRIGRTARAGKKGDAITFINNENIEHFNLIEKKINQSILKEQMHEFEYTVEDIVKEKGKAPVKGKRKSKKDKIREEQNNLNVKESNDGIK